MSCSHEWAVENILAGQVVVAVVACLTGKRHRHLGASADTFPSGVLGLLNGSVRFSVRRGS